MVAGLRLTLEHHDAAVRRELAEVHPDGTADSASSLADQRATAFRAKGALQVGDRLVLTKPLGFGVTTTALKQEKAAAKEG